jgi:hypothetical protein
VNTDQESRRPTLAKAAFWLVGVVVVAGIAWLPSCASRYTLGAEGTWPVSPAYSDHPIANTFGELVQYKSRDKNGTVWGPFFLQHQGVDILAVPHGDPSASEVIVTAEGKVKTLAVEPTDNYNEVVIRATDGAHEYTYIHIEHPADANLVAAKLNDATVHPGQAVGGIRHAFPCGYDHLHYGVARTDGTSETPINPLEKIRPKPDFISPDITAVHLARHALPRWQHFRKVGTRTVVNGTVDIVAAVTDRDDAGSAALAVRSLGTYDVLWRACPSANPNCDWNETHRYDHMPQPAPGIRELFSFACNQLNPTDCWTTVAEEWTDLTAWTWPEGYCPVGPSTYMVLRKGAGLPSWDTQEILNGSSKYPDGKYVLNVKALDYAALSDTYSVDVCVENSPPDSCQ